MMNKTFTLKELKELDAKATKKPWMVLSIHGDEFVSAIPYKDHPYFGCTTTIEVMSDEEYPTKSADAKLIAASRNALPELIRVIELAEGALKPLHDEINKDCSTWEEVAITAAAHIREIEQALSEIKKLKGE